MKCVAGFALVLGLVLVATTVRAREQANKFLTDAQDFAFVDETLARERAAAPPPIPVTGVTVPHHLLAADLIARGILAARGGTYDHVILLSPDHFRALETPFGITTADLNTVVGPLEADRDFAQAVLGASAMFSDTGTAPREHGIHAVTPFIRSVFPHARIVAITTATASTTAEWRAAADLLATLLRPRTLIVQSTDYSHFLPVGTAALRDQETLTALASGDPQAVLALNQPSHMDSRASQYIQMSLQRAVHGATPIIIANRNAYEYAPTRGPTTSYMVTVFTTAPELGGMLRYPDHTVMYFGGDTYLGRGWTEAVRRPATVEWLAQEITAITGGNPLVVNLEGVILEERPVGTNAVQHLMLAQLALPVLGRLGLVAVNLANNHTYDFGEEGFQETARFIQRAGMAVLRHGVVSDLGTLKVLPLTFKRGYFYDHAAIRSVAELDWICTLQGASPLIVLAHWGDDYTSTPGPFEMEVLDHLARCGVAAAIGAHSHQASKAVEPRAGGALQAVFSMGNLIFDQTGPGVSGSLVELRVFRQGTITLRIIPIANFFELQKLAGPR